MKNTAHFKSSEFECPCCGLELMSQSTVNKLEFARLKAGIPFCINSGTRCETHNREIDGATYSPHVPWLGVSYAADIAVSTSADRFKIIDSLLAAGFGRVGIGVNFVHADDDPTKASNVIWLYL